MSATTTSPFRSAQEKQQDRALKREAVLLAAVRMFNERGFFATSLDDVAASLGVTKPVIYHYLGNKEQVLFECVRRGIELLNEAALEAQDQRGTGLDRLKALMRRYAEITMGDFGRCVVRTGDEPLSPDARARFRALKRTIDQALRDMLAAAAADGSAQFEDLRITAFTLAGALNWPARWHQPNGDLPPEEISRKMVDLLCAGLAGPRPKETR